jgi:tetratricopeptide (TPR) repeat protein
VASRTSSFAYKGAQVPIDSIARALHVAHVLEGSVRRDGERVRITAQLINAESGYHAWSESYDRDVGSVFAVQDEIAHAIVSALELKLGGGRAGEALAREETSDPEAHTLVLKATQLRRSSQRAQIEEAIASLEQAIERDSGYARAWAILADTYTRMDYLGFAPRAEMVPKARVAAERARALDPQSADAEFALGMLARDYDWDVRAAEAHFRRAIELRPNMASAYTVLAWSLAQLGRGEESIAAAARAVDLDPVQPSLHTNLGSMYAYAGQLEPAVAEYRRSLALDEDAITLANLALSYADLDRYPEAIAAAERALAIGSDLEFSTAALAYVYGRAGNRAEAERHIRELEARPIRNGYLLATAYAGIGARERVLAGLEEAAAAREPGILDVAVDPVFAAYRDEPQVRRLLERMRLRQ